MKKVSIPCSFRGGSKSDVEFYVGNPQDGKHPIGHQAHWLSQERGGTVPQGVMDSISKIQELSRENGVPFDQLFEHAWSSSSQPNINEVKESMHKEDFLKQEVKERQ